jgi:hypothetical protein
MDKNFLFIIIVLLIIIVGGILIWQFWPVSQTDLVSCTQEAKFCPDGSSVVRTGPNCEFAECSTKEIIDTVDWLVYINYEYGFNLKYPKHWEYKEERESSQDIINDFGWLYYINLAPKGEEYSYEGTESFPIEIRVVKNINLYNELNKNYSGGEGEEKEDLLIGGLPATNFITKMGESIAWTSILTKEDNSHGYYFQIFDATHILYRTEEEKDDFFKTLQGVIDSFTMLKKETTN